LPDAAIAEPGVSNLNGGKKEGQGGRGHDVGEGDFAGDAAAVGALPHLGEIARGKGSPMMGKKGGVDGSGGNAGENGNVQMGKVPGKGEEKADLVGGACAASA